MLALARDRRTEWERVRVDVDLASLSNSLQLASARAVTEFVWLGQIDFMPFKSQAQRRKFAELLLKGEISNQTFEEWNRETGSAKLPERVKRKSKSKVKRTNRKTKTKRKRPKLKTKRRRK
jgi:hypothetical protein